MRSSASTQRSRPTRAPPGEPSGSIGLGFAIPINDAIPIVEQLRNGETPTHARIGVTVGDATDKVGLPNGALVGRVEPDTAASKAALRKGDVITKLDDNLITDADSPWRQCVPTAPVTRSR